MEVLFYFLHRYVIKMFADMRTDVPNSHSELSFKRGTIEIQLLSRFCLIIKLNMNRNA